MTRGYYLLALLSGTAAVPAAWAQTSDAPAQGQNGQEQFEDIVVTASRRSETILKTPIAVSAYSGDKLRAAQTVSLTDLVGPNPNIQIGNSYNSANVAIRGIGNGSSINAGSDAGVSIQVDGVYMAQPALTLSTFLDVARVEVLRGPQGTLFGRNATGGAVNIIPNEPTRDVHYGVDVRTGIDPGQINTSGYVSGPLDASGTWTARLSAQQTYNRGFTKNLSTPEPYPAGYSNNLAKSRAPSRLDDADNQSVRGQIKWEPSDSFNARLLVEYQRDHSNGPATFLEGTPDPTQPLPAILVGQSTGSVKKREVYANEGLRRVEGKNVNLTLNWALGNGDLKALGSYADTKIHNIQDGDGTDALHTYSDFKNKTHQYYGELLYTSDAALPFNYIIGTNYFHEKLQQDISVPISLLPMPVDLGAKINTTSYAFFGHAQYALTSKAKLFAGLRYTHDKKVDLDDYNSYVGILPRQSTSSSQVTYEVGASYAFSNTLDAYAKYATGYKGGGFSAGGLAPAFDPEKNTNLEAGLKGWFFDHRLQANIAAFHMKYNNLQVNQINGASTQVVNAAKATIYGIEAETVIRPIEALRFEVSGAYLHATFDRFRTGDPARPDLGTVDPDGTRRFDLDGNDLPQAPRYSISAGGYYDVPVSSGKVTLGARYDWKSRLYFSEFNIPVSSQSAAGKLNLSLNYESDDKRITASLFAKNITNKQVKSNVIVVSALIGSLALGQYQPPRQIGASFGYHF
ncbi:TonB-dependent receptor [Novosphingobium colocasiae]|uniref:TonB-dependent receptor n=1 Tax=Novosphingobium colocasiae TaxID=1256513 RepID=UPI0035B39EA4